MTVRGRLSPTLARGAGLMIAIAVAPSAAYGEDAASAASAASAPVFADTPRVAIQAGRALDFEGQPVYASKSAFSGTAAITTISTTRPAAARVSTAGAILPSQSPLLRGSVTSTFGRRRDPFVGGSRMHSGVDLAAPAGSPVLATSDGVVEVAGWAGGYGLLVKLRHSGNVQTLYGHMSGLAVRAGQSVHRGEVIGYVGSTGRSTGPHLHYEQRVNGAPVPPGV